MGIIYILTVLLMLILHMLLYKKEQKQNIIKWLSISAMILLCYNILVCAILTFIKIPSTLISLSIINIITNIGLGIKIYKDKKIQKYSIDIVDILIVLVMLAIVVTMIIVQYGIPFDIKHIITDGTTHYFAAKDFSEYSYLLIEENSDVLNLMTLRFLQPGAYINTGILFKVFSGIINETYMYHLYFIFDCGIWLLSGLLMYGLLIKGNKKKNKILPAILAIIYMIGYPLNSLVSGFSYLTMGLNIVTTILIVMQEKINKYYKYILMLLLDMGLLFTYYFFAPVVFLTIFLQIVNDMKKSGKKLITKDNILNIFTKFVIPGIFWLLYFVVYQALKFNVEPVYGGIVNIEGDIYSNFITNNLIFLVLSMSYVIYCIYNYKKSIKNNMLMIQIGFMLVLFFGMVLEKVSEYYFYKTYFLLWMLVIIISADEIRRLTLIGKKVKYATYATYAGIGIYILGIIYCVIVCNNLFVFDIYVQNSTELTTKSTIIIPYEEVELLDYYNKNININRDDTQTDICASKYVLGKYGWIYAITRNHNNYTDLISYDWTPDIEYFIEESDKKYFLIFKNDYGPRYNQIYEIIKEHNIQIIFETDRGMILEKI